jgi:hypothetical protein
LSTDEGIEPKHHKEQKKMKIASSEIEMRSTNKFTDVEEKKEELRLWSAGRPLSSIKSGRSARAPAHLMDRVTISDNFPLPLSVAGSEASEASGAETGRTEDEDVSLLRTNPKLYSVKKILERLTGKKIKVGGLDFKGSALDTSAGAPLGFSSQARRTHDQDSMGIAYNSREVHYESQTTRYSSKGIIQTTDGKEIRFSIDLQMSRQLVEEHTESFRAGEAALVDPLVINFNGVAGELTEGRYAFDINSDGSDENISFVGSGSGVLVLDLNKDGVVNNGTELFGPNSGDGFAELGAYDEDGNQWIDENDDIYDNLSVWTKDAEGKDTLTSLRESGVGALYLGKATTTFDMMDEAGKLQGRVVSTGIAVQEDGEVNTLQQIDFVL